MRASLIIFLLILVAPHLANAGHVYGTVMAKNRPVAYVSGRIICPSGSYPVQTDRHGSYSIYIKDKGRCTFCISYGRQEATHDLYSYDKPVRYDFDLIQQGPRYILRRR